jgi:hypothetical protein
MRAWPVLVGLTALAGTAGWPSAADAPRPSAPTTAARGVASRPTQPRTMSERFGFLGPDVYKAHGPADLVRIADLDADGRNDVLFVNNEKNRIVIYFQSTDGKLAKQEYNTERYIRDIAVGDFNGDGRSDLAYLGDPENVVVLLQRDQRRFADEQELRVKGRLLVAGDLNGDGRDDLVLVGKDDLQVLLTRPLVPAAQAGARVAFADPIKIEIEDPTIQRILLADIDGDGRLDLCTLGKNGQQITYRLQLRPPSSAPPPGAGPGVSAAPLFAPAVTQTLKDLRAADLAPLGAAPAARLLAFHNRTNALKVLALAAEEPKQPASAEEPYLLSSPRLYSFGASTARRAVAVGDLNRDGRPELLVADGGTAQLAVYRVGAGGPLADRAVYPTLSAATHLAVDSTTGEIFVVSPAERIIGVAREESSGRVTFPKPLGVADKPTAVALAAAGARGADLIYAAQNEQTRKSYIAWLFRQPDGRLVVPAPSAAPTAPPTSARIDIPDDDAVVSDLVPVDLDGDGLCDLMVFFEYQKPRLFLQRERGRFEDVSESSGFRKGLTLNLKRQELGLGDVNGDRRPELLVATRNFARSLALIQGAFEVTDQYNGRSGESAIVRAETLDLDGDGRNEIVLFDSRERELSILAQGKDQTYTIVQRVEVGPFTLRDLLIADLNADGRPDLVLVADDKFAVVYTGCRDRQFELVDEYQTLIEDGRYAGVTTGDLDADGRKEMLVIEGANAHVEILDLVGRSLIQELTFRVYDPGPRERPSRWNPEYSPAEPRRALIADLTGDGKDDLVLLIHDNLVIYRQE